MRKLRLELAAALLLALALVAPSLQAESTDACQAAEGPNPAPPVPECVDAAVAAPLAITLQPTATDARQLRFIFDEAASAAKDLDAVAVRLELAGETPIELALQQAGAVWQALYPMASPDLVKGPWTVTFVGVKDGASGTLASRTLQVNSSDVTSPKLALAVPAQTVVLGPGDSVALNVSDPLLRRVTYTFGGLPNGLPLAFPYALRGEVLPQGLSTVAFQALDRAGNEATLVVPVDRDAVLPELDLQLPAHAYDGAPFTFTALVREDGPHTLRFTSNGTLVSEVKIPGYAPSETNRTHDFTTVATGPGNLSIQVEAIDRAGNRALAAHEMGIEAPIVDAKAGTLRVEGSGPLYVQDAVRLNATASQAGGVRSLPLTVTIEVAGRSSSATLEVAPGQTKGFTWESKLPAGRHTARASVAAPPFANETQPGNENATLEIEVFLGRIEVDGNRFDIRASDQGLPVAAVEGGSTKSYPLKIVDSGGGIAYSFTTSANRTYVWDPLLPVDDRDGNETSSSSASSTADGSKGAPAPGLLLVLAVVALAALARRRR